MLLSYFIGQHKAPIPYDLRSIGFYTLLTLCLLAAYYAARFFTSGLVIPMAVGTVLLIIYILILVRRDFPLSGLPLIGKYFPRR